MRNFKKRKSNLDSGFTLIELLVVIIIIVILAGIAVIGVSGAQNAAAKKACQANATQVAKGLRAYYSLQSPATFPTKAADNYTRAELEASLKDGANGRFLENVPAEVDSFTGAKYKLDVTVDNTAGTISITSTGTNACDAVTG